MVSTTCLIVLMSEGPDVRDREVQPQTIGTHNTHENKEAESQLDNHSEQPVSSLKLLITVLKIN